MNAGGKVKFSSTPEYVATKDRFRLYYKREIYPVLQKMEKTRKKYLFVFEVLFCAVAGWVVYIGMLLNRGFSELAGNSIGGYGAIACFLSLLMCWPMFSYYRRGKENLLPLFAGFFGEFSYLYRPQIPEEILGKSLLFPKGEIFSSDDSFNGEYKGVPVNIAEFFASRKISRYNRQENRRIYEDVKTGGGIIFQARMNKNFAGKTIIVRDKGWRNMLARYKDLHRAGIESPEFEKSYEVYTDNQIEARYILTSVMLEYMVELKGLFPQIEFSFFEHQVLIKIQTKKNLFECTSFFQSLINKKRMEKIFNEFYLLFSVIDIMRINQNRML